MPDKTAIKPTRGDRVVVYPKCLPTFRTLALILPFELPKPLPDVVGLCVRDEFLELANSRLSSDEQLHAVSIANHVRLSPFGFADLQPLAANGAGEEAFAGQGYWHRLSIVNGIFLMITQRMGCVSSTNSLAPVNSGGVH